MPGKTRREVLLDHRRITIEYPRLMSDDELADVPETFVHEVSFVAMDMVAAERGTRNSSRDARLAAPVAGRGDRVPTLIVIILGVEALIVGAVHISIAGFQGGGIASFILGAFNILIGLLLLASPMAAALAIPFVFGLILLVQGVTRVILAFRVRA